MKYSILFIVLLLVPEMLVAQYGSNLLTNPGAESEYTGWTKTDGGTGWNTTFRTARTGDKSWASSSQNCTLIQTVDLLAQGYTAGVLDASPTVLMSVYVFPGWDGSPGNTSKGSLTILVELLNASDGVVSSNYIANNITLPVSTADSWASYSTEISGYSTGVRKVKVTFVAKDAKNWGGQYGPMFDDASLQLNGSLPVELTSFTAKNNHSGVTLHWQTATEVNNYGFEIERAVGNSNTDQWSKIGFIEGNGTTNAPKSYSFTDKSAAVKTSYRLKQIDRDGKFEYSKTVEVTAASAPKEFGLEQNYPNPFNPTTMISYQLPASNHVSLKVFDLLGKEVATLVNETKEAGTYTAQFDGAQYSSGLYFYKLTTNQFSSIRKMQLLK